MLTLYEPTLLFTDYKGMSIAEICKPLSAKTMPLRSRWGFGGLEMDHVSVLQQQRVQVTKLFLRNKRREKR